MTSDLITITKTIPAARVAEARKRAQRWAAWAVKQGIPAPEVAISEPAVTYSVEECRAGEWSVIHLYDREDTASFAMGTILGDRPGAKLRCSEIAVCEMTVTAQRLQTEDGCVLAGVLRRSGDAVVPTCVPGQTFPAAICDRFGECDHCQTRRRRRETFVLRRRNGTYICVGRGCLRPTLGFSPAQLLSEIALRDKVGRLDAETGRVRRTEDVYTIDRVVRASIVAMRSAGGYLPSRAANSTRGRVHDLLTAMPPANSEWAEALRDLRNQMDTDEVREEARQAIEWAQSIPESTTVDFRLTMRSLAQSGIVTSRFIGAACYLPVAYAKEAGEDLVLRSHLPARVNSFIGEPDEVVEVTVFPIAMRVVPTGFGPSTIVTGRTDDGRDVRWFTTSGPAIDKLQEAIDSRGTVVARGRVKQHQVRETSRDDKARFTLLGRVRLP